MKELNRRVTRYRKDIIKHQVNGRNLSKDIDTDAYWEEDKRLREEGAAILKLDRTLEKMNAKSIRTMVRANSKFRFEALHMFGVSIDLEKI